MGHQGLLALSVGCAGMAFLVLVTRVFHPHHREIALVIYGLGWIPFLASVWRLRTPLQEGVEAVGAMLPWGIHVGFLVGLLVSAWALKTLFPVERSPLLDLDEAALVSTIESDLQVLAYVDDKLQAIVEELVESEVVQSAETELAVEDARWLRTTWVQFLQAGYELELLKYRYRAFYQVNALTRPSEHSRAFLIAYGAHVSQYRAGLMVTAALVGHETARQTLDDAHPDAGISSRSFSRIQRASVHPDEVLRLNAGRAYLALVEARFADDDAILTRTKSYLGEVDRLVGEKNRVFVKNPLDVLERQASRAWYPLQKGVAVQMSRVRTVNREYFISTETLAQEGEGLLPGDILLTRREWHLTNLGIPGYWTHAALYLGRLDQIDEYFADLPELLGETAAEQIQRSFPEAYAAMSGADSSGHPLAVLEALSPGVVLTSLQASGSTDSLAALRPKVTKSERWRALIAALPHMGKPYNYQFDFRIETALVCSQLVHKAYQEINSFHLQPRISNGRLLLSPNEIAKKFDEEFELDSPEMEMVFFLDGSGIGEVKHLDAEAFRASWLRPKWHIVFQ